MIQHDTLAQGSPVKPLHTRPRSRKAFLSLEKLTPYLYVFPAVLFLGLSGVTTALLNSQRVFTYPAFSVAIYNLGIIIAALLFATS